jgi:hypothetical protein
VRLKRLLAFFPIDNNPSIDDTNKETNDIAIRVVRGVCLDVWPAVKHVMGGWCLSLRFQGDYGVHKVTLILVNGHTNAELFTTFRNTFFFVLCASLILKRFDFL